MHPPPTLKKTNTIHYTTYNTTQTSNSSHPTYNNSMPLTPPYSNIYNYYNYCYNYTPMISLPLRNT